MLKAVTKYCSFLLLIAVLLCYFSCNKKGYDSSSSSFYKQPNAIAGPDQLIALPTDSALLDGSASNAPGGTISRWLWTEISGPDSLLSIADVTKAKTVAKNLNAGTYQFMLTVTDNHGVGATDTIQVTVSDCNHTNWQIVNATSTSIGTLSEARIPFAAAAGNKVVFAGGEKSGTSCDFFLGSSAVDIYDVSSHTWSVAQLSRSRLDMSVATAGSKIFFAGGHDYDLQPGGLNKSYDNVDIYDASNNTWELTHLSEARQNMAVAVTANKVFFAGGNFFTSNLEAYSGTSKVVDIYDLLTKSWSAATLSFAGDYYAAVLGDKIYFVGGPNSGVDIYNNITNTWSTADFQTVIASLSPPAGMGGIDRFSVAGDNIIFWSGLHQAGVRNITTGSTSVSCLSNPTGSLFVNVFVNNSVVFLYANNKFDIYNPATRVWSTGVLNSGLPSNLLSPSVTTLNNTIYLGGGQYKDSCIYHTEVYSLAW